MTKLNANNERIKRSYFRYLKEADRKAESTIRGIEIALSRYEAFTDYADFKTFNRDHAVGFKKALPGLSRRGAGIKLSLSTIHTTLKDLKKFFRWLACQPGFKSAIRLTDVDYLNMSERDARAAKAPRPRNYPTIEQVRHVIASCPDDTEADFRDRALVTLALLTGMRDSALVSLQLKHVDLDKKRIIQDPREVRTKYRKGIITYFLPLGDDLEAIVVEWVTYLREVRLFGVSDPLFPRTALGQDEDWAFCADGLEPVFWATTSPVRDIFHRAFERAGLSYFNPHSFRHTLVDWAQGYYQKPEEFKAFSQNIGHESPLTTFVSYGRISGERQGELIRSPKHAEQGNEEKLEEILDLLRGERG